MMIGKYWLTRLIIVIEFFILSIAASLCGFDGCSIDFDYAYIMHMIDSEKKEKKHNLVDLSHNVSQVLHDVFMLLHDVSVVSNELNELSEYNGADLLKLAVELVAGSQSFLSDNAPENIHELYDAEHNEKDEHAKDQRDAIDEVLENKKFDNFKYGYWYDVGFYKVSAGLMLPLNAVECMCLPGVKRKNQEFIFEYNGTYYIDCVVQADCDWIEIQLNGKPMLDINWYMQPHDMGGVEMRWSGEVAVSQGDVLALVNMVNQEITIGNDFRNQNRATASLVMVKIA
jgi:hypothetical protein